MPWVVFPDVAVGRELVGCEDLVTAAVGAARLAAVEEVEGHAVRVTHVALDRLGALFPGVDVGHVIGRIFCVWMSGASKPTRPKAMYQSACPSDAAVEQAPHGVEGGAGEGKGAAGGPNAPHEAAFDHRAFISLGLDGLAWQRAVVVLRRHLEAVVHVVEEKTRVRPGGHLGHTVGLSGHVHVAAERLHEGVVLQLVDGLKRPVVAGEVEVGIDRSCRIASWAGRRITRLRIFSL